MNLEEAGPVTIDSSATVNANVSTEIKIGLALSGGGSRAAIFHLGVLRFIASIDLIGKIGYISTVSGGSLAVALVFKENNYAWPLTEKKYADAYGNIRNLMEAKNLQKAYITKALNPINWPRFFNRANVLSEAIGDTWGIKKALDELPPQPRWSINGTNMEYGKHWHFYAECVNAVNYVSMGDSNLEPQRVQNFPITDAVAASAAFPGGVTPFRIEMRKYRVEDQTVYHIADGGVYDNLGLESLIDIGDRVIHPESGCNFIIVCDAGKPLQRFSPWPRWANIVAFSKNTIDIMETECRTLRARAFVGGIKAGRYKGLFVNIAENAGDAITKYRKKFPKMPLPNGVNANDYLSSEDVANVVGYGTNFSTPDKKEFTLIEEHGFQAAKLQWLLYGP